MAPLSRPCTVNVLVGIIREMANESFIASSQTERQLSVNDFWSYTLNNYRAALSPHATVYILVSSIANKANDMLIISSKKWTSIEHQWFLAFHLGKSKGDKVTLTHERTIGHLSLQQCSAITSPLCFKKECQYSVNSFGLASWTIQGQCGNIHLQLNYLPPLFAKILSTTSLLCPQT